MSKKNENKPLKQPAFSYQLPHYFNAPDEDKGSRFCRCGKYLTDDVHLRQLKHETKIQLKKIMNIEQEIQNILDRNFTRGDNANALKELLFLYNAVEQSEQLKAFVDWWHGLSQEELAWYEGRYVEVFLSL